MSEVAAGLVSVCCPSCGRFAFEFDGTRARAPCKCGKMIVVAGRERGALVILAIDKRRAARLR